MRRASSIGVWRATLLPALFATHPALVLAHAPPEGLSILTDEQGEVAVVVTNRGLLLRDPATSRTRLLCVEAMHGTVSDPPHVALLSGGRLVIGTFEGLLTSTDQGCTWQPIPPFEATSVTAVAMGGHDLQTVVIATFGADTSGLYITRDGGSSFESLRPLGGSEYVSSLAVSTTDPDRLYAGVEDFSTGDVALFLLRSLDGGATWERIALDQQPTDFRLIVQAVAPQDPDTLLVSSVALDPAGTPGRLLESHDGGDSFAVVFDDFEISSAGYRRSGGAWVTSKSGLFEAAGTATNFAQTWDMTGVSCAEEHSGELFVCGSFPQADDRLVPGIGRRVSDRGQPIAPFLIFSEADQPVACAPATDSDRLCQVPWLDWQREVLSVNGAASAPQTSGDPDIGAAPNLDTMAPDGSTPRPMAHEVSRNAAAPPESALDATTAHDGTESANSATVPPSTMLPSAERVEGRSNGGCSVSGSQAPSRHHGPGWWGYWACVAILGWIGIRVNFKIGDQHQPPRYLF